MRIWDRCQKLWPLIVFVAAAAAVASAQSIPSTEYRYDNNGNLHQVSMTCDPGLVLCGSQCLPSDVNNCGTCGKKCPGVLNGYPTCPASQCGLGCATGYSLNGSTCALQFLAVGLNVSSFATTYSGTLTWTTAVPTTTRIRYRAVSNDRVSADPWTEVSFGAGLSTAHVATMVDLFPVANYEYQAISTDGGGATFSSSSYFFSTPKGAYDVGVISFQDSSTRARTCPGHKDLVRFYLDNEDYHNANDRRGWIGGIGSDSMGTWLPFCRINGQKLRPLSSYLNTAYEYAVLSLSSTCPAGSVSFWRHFDNEDGNEFSRAWIDTSSTIPFEGNYYAASPNTLDDFGNTRLHFCMFRYSASPMANFPSLSQPYGVFAPSSFARAVQKGWVYTDDEDTNTGNAYGSPYPSESQLIVSSGNNTYLYTAQAACGPGSASNAGQVCGSCGGSVQCDGSCSVATPGNVGQACGCGGTVLCSGACSKPACPIGKLCSGGICTTPPDPSGCLPAGSDCGDGTCCKGCNIKLQVCRY